MTRVCPAPILNSRSSSRMDTNRTQERRGPHFLCVGWGVGGHKSRGSGCVCLLGAGAAGGSRLCCHHHRPRVLCILYLQRNNWHCMKRACAQVSADVLAEDADGVSQRDKSRAMAAACCLGKKTTAWHSALNNGRLSCRITSAQATTHRQFGTPMQRPVRRQILRNISGNEELHPVDLLLLHQPPKLCVRHVLQLVRPPRSAHLEAVSGKC